jgi:hypothetical protein
MFYLYVSDFDSQNITIVQSHIPQIVTLTYFSMSEKRMVSFAY